MSKPYPCPSGQSTLTDAKTRLNIHALWPHFGFDGEPKASCRCPWREDHNASFSVNVDGTLWNDFATGEAGDAVDFFQRASGLSQKKACRKFMELAGGRGQPAQHAARPPARTADTKARPAFPEFRQGTAADFRQLANLRQIGREGLEWASERGLLWFATLKDCPAWIVTDSARLNAQARRMDGHAGDFPPGRRRQLDHPTWGSQRRGRNSNRGKICCPICEKPQRHGSRLPAVGVAF